MKSIIWTIEKEILQNLCDESSSYVDVLRKLDLTSNGIQQTALKKRFLEDDICLDNLLKNRKEKRKNQSCKLIPIEDVLVENSNYSRTSLKKRLIDLGIFENICDECGLGPLWEGKLLILQLDHKNGVSNDNRLVNLRLLCPNCHSQTDTFNGRKKTHESWSKLVKCPPKNELSKLLEQMPTKYIGQKYGVCCAIVNKWLKSYGLVKPPSGYWGKHNKFRSESRCGHGTSLKS